MTAVDKFPAAFALDQTGRRPIHVERDPAVDHLDWSAFDRAGVVIGMRYMGAEVWLSSPDGVDTLRCGRAWFNHLRANVRVKTPEAK